MVLGDGTGNVAFGSNGAERLEGDDAGRPAGEGVGGGIAQEGDPALRILDPRGIMNPSKIFDV